MTAILKLLAGFAITRKESGKGGCDLVILPKGFDTKSSGLLAYSAIECQWTSLLKAGHKSLRLVYIHQLLPSTKNKLTTLIFFMTLVCSLKIYPLLSLVV